MLRYSRCCSCIWGRRCLCLPQRQFHRFSQKRGQRWGVGFRRSFWSRSAWGVSVRPSSGRCGELRAQQPLQATCLLVAVRRQVFSVGK